MIGEAFSSLATALYQPGVGWVQSPLPMNRPPTMSIAGGVYDRVRGTIVVSIDSRLTEYFGPSNAFQSIMPMMPPPANWPAGWTSDALGAMFYDSANEQLFVLLSTGLLYGRPSR